MCIVVERVGKEEDISISMECEILSRSLVSVFVRAVQVLCCAVILYG